MALTVPGTTTVTVLRRVRQGDTTDPTKWARDDRGNALYTTERIDVPGCSVQPGASTEQTDEQRVQVTSLITVYALGTFPGGSIDAIEVDGRTYEVQGRPQRWLHPRLGHVVVIAREVTG